MPTAERLDSNLSLCIHTCDGFHSAAIITDKDENNDDSDRHETDEYSCDDKHLATQEPLLHCNVTQRFL